MVSMTRTRFTFPLASLLQFSYVPFLSLTVAVEDRTRTTQQSPESSETLQNEGPEPPQSKVESAGGGDRSRYVGGTFWSMISDEVYY